VSHCGQLQRAWRNAAFPQRVAESGPLFRSRGCWRRPPSLSPQAPPPLSREAQVGREIAIKRFSAAVATSREGHRKPRSGPAVQHRRWGRGRRRGLRIHSDDLKYRTIEADSERVTRKQVNHNSAAILCETSAFLIGNHRAAAAIARAHGPIRDCQRTKA
jgi:hypothetical protein